MDGTRRDRRGREGRGADALQRRAHRRRLAAGGRHRRRPARGHAPRPPSGMPSALAVHRAVGARARCSTRARASTWRRWPARAEIADLLDLDRPLGETLALIAERKGSDIRDVMVVMLDRQRHEEAAAEIREAGARIRLITDGDVSAALLAVSEQRAGRPAVGHRRHAGGRHHRRGDQVHGRRDASAACGRATTTSARPPSTPATTSTACSPTTTSSPATTASSRPPA